jgi:hypothetical protein
MSGCLLRLALLPPIVAGFYLLFSLRQPWPTLVLPAEGAEVAAVIAGLFAWFGAVSWLDKRQITSELAKLERWELEDNERAVVSGNIKAQAPLLKAPFSAEECVGYWYNVSHYTRRVSQNEGTWWTDYEGYALIPSVVQGPLRTVHVLANPDKELFQEAPMRELSDEDVWSRAEEYLNITDFGEANPGLVGDTRTRRIHDGPGNFREDKCVGKPPQNLRDCRLQETVIREGDKVLISGVYSVEQDGILPDPDSVMRPFHIVVGGEAALKRKIRNRIIAMVVSLGITVCVAALYYMLFALQQS